VEDRSCSCNQKARVVTVREREFGRFFLAKPSKEDLTIMHDLMATGKVTPVIATDRKNWNAVANS